MKTNRRPVVGLATLLVVLGAAAAPVAATAGDEPHLVTHQVKPTGAVTLAWKVHGAKITYTGGDPNAEVVSSSATPDGAGGVTVSARVVSSLDLDRPAAELVADFARRDPRQAEADPATAAALRAIEAGRTGSRSVLSAARAAGSGPIIDSWCVLSDWDGDDVHAKTCNVRRLDQQRTSPRLTNWLSESTTGSAWSDDGQNGHGGCLNCDGIDKYYGELAYMARAGVVQIPQWAPNTTIRLQDSCRTVTASVQGPSGFDYGTSQTVCPDTIGPYGVDAQSSGSQWKGDSAGPGKYRGILFSLIARTYEGVQSTSLLHGVHIT
jgi:hypothetical protein